MMRVKREAEAVADLRAKARKEEKKMLRAREGNLKGRVEARVRRK